MGTRATGLDVGTVFTHYAVIDENRVVDVGRVQSSKVKDLDLEPPVFIEFPDARFYGRANAAVIIALCRVSAEIGRRLTALRGYDFVEFVGFQEWTGDTAPSREEIDAAFVKYFSNVKKKGKNIYVDGKATNEHHRDAALIALWGREKRNRTNQG
ncbi:MAG: hypothetical protein KatS3mg104_2927 [Phycisphaerae bacterium]|nr:MAG: hypothetical protein KatS3mg104_2927 [Phycisphaerae bacterium]